MIHCASTAIINCICCLVQVPVEHGLLPSGSNRGPLTGFISLDFVRVCVCCRVDVHVHVGVRMFKAVYAHV